MGKARVAPRPPTEAEQMEQEAMNVDPKSVRQEYADSWELGYCLCDVGGPSKPFLALLSECVFNWKGWYKLAKTDPRKWRKFKQANVKESVLPNLVQYWQVCALAICFGGLAAGVCYSKLTKMYDDGLNRVMYLLGGGDPLEGGLTADEFEELGQVYVFMVDIMDDLCRTVGYTGNCRSACDQLKLERMEMVDCIRDFSDEHAGAAKAGNFLTTFLLLVWQYCVHWSTWFALVVRETPCWCCCCCWCDKNTWYIGSYVRWIWLIVVACNGAAVVYAGLGVADPFFRADDKGERWLPATHLGMVGLGVAAYCYAGFRQLQLALALARVPANEELKVNERKKRNILKRGEKCKAYLAQKAEDARLEELERAQRTNVTGKRGGLRAFGASEAHFQSEEPDQSTTDDEVLDERPPTLPSGRYYTVGRSGACNLGQLGGASVLG